MSHSPAQLLKGVEEEAYTGTVDGDVIGLSHQIAAELEGYGCEPDSRNVEYATHPHRCYQVLGEELLRLRDRLYAYLEGHGGLTLIPGGTLSLGDTRTFFRSRPDVPYHDMIERTYGTSVVTASEHINIGLTDTEELIRLCRVVRCEAALFLALTACSPFIDGQVTGYHSYRWKMFPKTPVYVPLFASAGEYVRYIEAQLESGVMHNSRHLWLSVRPNGIEVPYALDRLELRICDRIPDPDLVFAVTAFLEARVWQVLESPALDPLRGAFSAGELVRIAAGNEEAVSRESLDAVLTRWENGEQVRARDWLGEMLDQLGPAAEAHGFGHLLHPVSGVLADGNTAMKWLSWYAQGLSVRDVIRRAMRETAEKNLEYKVRLC